MLIIRPIALHDLDALLDMAKSAGAGFTSLPPDRDFLRAKIELSLHSFAADVTEAGHERYLLVLERDGIVGGCCAIEAACGLDEPFYNYRIGTTVHACREIGVYGRSDTLYLSNDYTGTSVLCSLYLRPEFRGGGAGKLLSKCRFLLMANQPHRFAEKVIAEMRGVSDEQGRSAFWEGLGRHFFSMDYDRAEHLVGAGNKAFIAELMPKHPIYTVLLQAEARAVIGQVHAHTAPALHLLKEEGFRYQGYIDIFDGGPTVETPLARIRTLRKSLVLPVKVGDVPANSPLTLITNQHWPDFRCVLQPAVRVDDHWLISGASHTALGQPVRVRAVGLGY
jgi:arginine N-succinyltransferase